MHCRNVVTKKSMSWSLGDHFTAKEILPTVTTHRAKISGETKVKTTITTTFQILVVVGRTRTHKPKNAVVTPPPKKRKKEGGNDCQTLASCF
jgi:hypothetical protein